MTDQPEVDDRAVIFLHIPKAGGTTLYDVLLRQYGRGENAFIIDGDCPETSINEFIALPGEKRQRIKVLMGHQSFGLHAYLPQPSTYITMLRDPVERIISHYHFIFQNPRHYLYEQVRSQELTLEDYLRQQTTIELDNGQTRAVFGPSGLPFGACTRDMLEQAKRHLRDHFAAVGILERYDESMILFKRRLGWRMPFYVRSKTTRNRPQRSQIAPEIIDLIKQTNELDIELYRYGQTLFEEAVGSQEATFSRELVTFRRLNGVYSRSVLALRRSKHFQRRAVQKLSLMFGHDD